MYRSLLPVYTELHCIANSETITSKLALMPKHGPSGLDYREVRLRLLFVRVRDEPFFPAIIVPQQK